MLMGIGFARPSLKSPDRGTIFCSHFAEFDGVGLNDARDGKTKERFQSAADGAWLSYG